MRARPLRVHAPALGRHGQLWPGGLRDKRRRGWPTASTSILDAGERAGRFDELRQPLVVSGEQIELDEGFVIRHYRKASTDGDCPVVVVTDLFGMSGGSWVRHHRVPPWQLVGGNDSL